MGIAKTSEMIALFELGRRYLIPADKPVITSTDDAVEQLKDLRSKRQECFAVLTLDGANRLISNEIVFQGTLDRSIITLGRYLLAQSRIELRALLLPITILAEIQGPQKKILPLRSGFEKLESFLA